MRPVLRRAVIRHDRTALGRSGRRTCRAMGFGRDTHRYQARRDVAVALRMRLTDLAASHVRYGDRRLQVLLQREGRRPDHKRVYRLCNEEGLSVRTRSPRRRRACCCRSGRSEADAMNEPLAMDFVSDRLSGDRSVRIPTIARCHTREALATTARTTLRAYQVIEKLDRPARTRDEPRSMRVDNDRADRGPGDAA